MTDGMCSSIIQIFSAACTKIENRADPCANQTREEPGARPIPRTFPIKVLEVGADGVGRCEIRRAQQWPGGVRRLAQMAAWDRLLGFEDEDFPGFREKPFAIAAAGGLGDGIETSQGTEDDREIADQRPPQSTVWKRPDMAVDWQVACELEGSLLSDDPDTSGR